MIFIEISKLFRSIPDLQTVRAHSIRMLVNWRLVFKIVMRNGLKTITSELKRVVWVRAVAIVVVHRRHIHPVADRMALAMEMVMHQIWAHFRRHHQVCSIQHRVSISHFHLGHTINGLIRFYLCIKLCMIIRFHCIHWKLNSTKSRVFHEKSGEKLLSFNKNVVDINHSIEREREKKPNTQCNIDF